MANEVRGQPPKIKTSTGEIPVIGYDRDLASQAYDAYRAMITTQRAYPHLVENPAWVNLRQIAFDNFAAAFKG